MVWHHCAVSQDLFGDNVTGWDLWLEFMFFNLVVIIITVSSPAQTPDPLIQLSVCQNFISHTVGAITMMPVIAKVSQVMRLVLK